MLNSTKGVIMNDLFSALKPNVLILSVIGAFVVWLTESEQIASLLVGGLVTVMFMLAGPKPNPKVSKEFAMAVTGNAVGGPSASTAHLALTLIIFIGIVLGVAALFGIVSEAAMDNVLTGYVGAVVTLAGKMAAPDDSDTVPESTVLAVLPRKDDP